MVCSASNKTTMSNNNRVPRQPISMTETRLKMLKRVEEIFGTKGLTQTFDAALLYVIMNEGWKKDE